MVRVIVCRPSEIVAIEEIDDSLESMQQLVGGMIKEYVVLTNMRRTRTKRRRSFS